MSKEDFNLAMYYLDMIESALNNIAISVGHQTIDERPPVLSNGFTGG